MPDATITSTASTFGTISGVFSADQSTITGTVAGSVVGTLDGSVGVPGPQGPTGATGATGATGPAGPGVPAGGTAGQFLTKIDGTNYNTDWTTVNLAQYLTTANAAATYQTLAGMSSYLTTASAASTYAPIAAGMPTSGTVGQVLTKNSGTNYDASWATLIPGDRYLTTSTTSLSVSNGAKTMTVGTGLSYSSQQDVVISYNASNHMHALVTSYNSGTGVLVVDVQNHTGSGTYSSWTVNVGGTTPLQSVAWGEIVGVLGNQSDLSTALNAKLDSSTAASTYQTQAGMSSYLTTASAASTYAPIASPTFTGTVTIPAGASISGYLTTSSASSTYAPIASPTFTGTPAAPTPAVDNNTTQLATTAYFIGQAGSSLPIVDGTASAGASSRWSRQDHVHPTDTSRAPTTSPSFSGTPLAPTAAVDTNTTQIATTAYVIGQGYLKSATASSIYAPLASPALTGTPTSTTAAVDTNTTQIATTAYVVGQGYLKSATATSTYAPLASPALTGTPTAPTATAGTNTTQIATTAFVTAAIPAFATETQAIYGTSSTTALSPLLVRHILANPMLTTYNSLVGNYSSFVSGSGSVSTVWSNLFAVQITAANGKAAFQPNSQVSYHSIQSRGKAELTVDWTKPMWFSFRFCYSSSGTIGDSNTVNRVTIGKVSSSFGDLTSRGFGVKWTAGTSGAFTVMAHNGTSQTTSASSVTVSNTTYFPTTSSAADFLVYSDGAGNVTLYCNNVQVATTTGGPSSGTSPGPRFVFESDNTTSTSGTVTCDYTGVKSMLAY